MTASPASLAELQEAVATAPGRLRLSGHGTKRPPVTDAADTLDVRGLAGIVSYDPEECVVSVLAGTPVLELDAALDAHGQYLPFDPPYRRAGATIGGTVAAGVSGSGRYRYGGVRDFVIGARVVDGQGRLIHTGGQVVKNAAGFLLHHALVGSAGRLGAIGELTFKVFPRPEARATVQVPCSSAAQAVAVHERVRTTIQDLDALDLDTATSTVWVRVAGTEDALPARIARTQQAAQADSGVLSGDSDAQNWSDAGEFAWAPAGHTVVKLPCAPSRLAAVADTLRGFGPQRSTCGGAVVWLATAAPLAELDDVLTARGWRGAVIRGPEHGRLLGPAPAEAFGARVRATLDPTGRFV